jgi:adenylate cyclase
LNNALRPVAYNGRGWTSLVVLIGFLACLLQIVPHSFGPLLQIEHNVKDSLWRSLANEMPEQRIVVIDIDEKSLRNVGPWPWPRAQLAQLLEGLVSDYGVRMIGLDVVFPAHSDLAGDLRLQALSQLAPIVFAQVFDMSDRLEPIISGVPIVTGLHQPGNWLPAKGYLANHSGLSQARCAGNISSVIDSDGAVRRLAPAVTWGQAHHLTLSLAMLACDPQTAKSLPELVKGLSSPYWEMPFNKHLEAYTVITAGAILQQQIDPAILRGKWVLVGSSALGLNDNVSTPLGSSVSGVMVHAQALTTWLDRLDNKPSALSWPWAQITALSWTVFSICLLAWAMGQWRAWLLLPIGAALTAAWFGLARGLLALQQPFSASAPILAYLAVLLVVPVAWWLTQKERKQLLNTFATFVAPSVLDKMLKQGLEKPLTPRHTNITVLSADMQNYSGLTASGSLEATANLTRGFLHCITTPLLKHQGTLDKYTGDGLVAFWGAPLPTEEPANQAMLAALEMVQAVHAWNLQRISQGLPPARLRIGIESGLALVGDLGTPFRSTYTAVGTCINSASKIQAAAKHYPHDILVGEVVAPAISVVRLIKVGDIQWGENVRTKTVYAPHNSPSSCPPLVVNVFPVDL